MNNFCIGNMFVSKNFPDPSLCDDGYGLVAFGGKLDTETLLNAYSNGIFPWFEDDEQILWWSPDPRIVLYTKDVHVSKSMKKLIKREHFQLSFDRDFKSVIRSCANIREITWITPGIIRAYEKLHKSGYAHSIEVWRNKKLAGGLYGVSLGKIFFGESMFSIESNSSKYALIKLSWFLNSIGFKIIDCQIPNTHLKSLGAIDIPRIKFLKLVKENNKLQSIIGSWEDMSEDLNKIVKL